MELLTSLTSLTKSNSIKVIKDDFRFSTIKIVFLTNSFFLIFFTFFLQAQTITLNSVVPDKSLVGTPQNVTLTFTVGGGFNKQNIFKAELSDASGAFNPPTTTIGQTTNKSRTINCIIPGTLPSGTGYSIRIVSTLPLVISNVKPFSITPIGPAGTITGSSVVCQGQDLVTYSITPIPGATNYIWTLQPGCSIVSGHNSSEITVNFSESAISGNISVYGTDGTFNGNSSSLTVTVNKLPLITSQPLSSLNICPGTSKSFSVTATGTGTLSYQWFRNGSKITGATKSTYSVGKVTASMTGIYRVDVTNSCGTTSSNDAELGLDAVSPVWITVNGTLDVTIPCNNSKALSTAQSMAPEASDNCLTGLTSTKTSGTFIPAGDVSCSGTYVNTWIAADAAGNTSYVFTQTITVDENAGIVITKPATDLIVECDGSVNETEFNNWLSSNAGATAKSSCGAVSWTYDISALDPDGITTVSFTVTDDCGNPPATVQASFIISDNNSPVPDVKNLPGLDLSCNEEIPVPTATDACQGPIAGMTEDKITGLQCGTYTISWYYEDASGNIYFQDQVVNIIDNTPPDISQLHIDNLDNGCMNAESRNQTILDWLGPVQEWMKDWVSDNCGRITITNDYDFNDIQYTCGQAEGYLIITFKIEDDCGNYVEYPVQWNFLSEQPTVITPAQNKSIEVCNGEFDQTELNDWLNSHGGAEVSWPCGNVEWSNNFDDIYNDSGPGTYTIYFTATTECGQTISSDGLLTIWQNNINSVVVGPQQGTLCEGINGSNVIYDVVVTRDACSAESFQVQLGVTSENGGMPDGIAYAFTVEYPWVYEFGPDDEEIHATMQIWSYSENAPSLQNHEITLRAFDPAIGHPNADYGDYAEAPVPITTGSFANNIVPEKETLEDVTVECLYDAAPIAHDVCHGNNLLTGMIRFHEELSPGVYRVTWFFSDGRGYELDQGPHIITLSDSEAPIPHVAQLPDISVECFNDFWNNHETPTASDNCDGEMLWAGIEKHENNGDRTYTVYWAYTDWAGNKTTQTQKVILTDITPPDISRVSEIENFEIMSTGCKPTIEALDFYLSDWVQAVTLDLTPRISDNCENFTVTNDYNINNLSAGCGTTGTITITFTFTDDAGNSWEVHSNWTIYSFTPEVVKWAEGLTVEMRNGEIDQTALNGWLASNGGGEVSWSCGNVEWSNNFNEVYGAGGLGNYPVTFTATSECGDKTTMVATLTVSKYNIGSVKVGPQQGHVCPLLSVRVTYELTVTREVGSVGAIDVRLGVTGFNGGHLEGIYDFWYEKDGIYTSDLLHFTETDNSQTVTVVIQKKPVYFDGTHELMIRAYDPALGHPNSESGDFAEDLLTFTTGYPNPPDCPVIRTVFTSNDNCEVTLADVAASNQFCTPVTDLISRSDKSGPFGIGSHTINYTTSDGSTCLLSFEVKGKNIGDVQMGAQQGIICQGSPWRIEYPVTINRHVCSSEGTFDLEIHFIVPAGTPDLSYGLADIQSPVHFEPGQTEKTVNVFISSSDGTYAGGYDLTLRILPAGKWAESYQGLAEYKEVSQFMQSCDPETKSAQIRVTGDDSHSTAVKEIPDRTKDEIKNDVLPAFVKAYPNPFNDEIKFEFSSSFDTNAKLEIFNVLGSSMGVIFDEKITGGVLNMVSYHHSFDFTQFIFYRIIIGDKIFIGKLIHQK